jgi:hypothetical protein
MVATAVVTNDGLNAFLTNTFPTELGAVLYGYMALGTLASTFDDEDTALGSECNPATQTGYERVALTVTRSPETNSIQLEGLFDLTNISVSTTIKELGVVNTDVLGEGTFFCLCRIPDMPKYDDLQLRFVVTISVSG